MKLFHCKGYSAIVKLFDKLYIIVFYIRNVYSYSLLLNGIKIF